MLDGMLAAGRGGSHLGNFICVVSSKVIQLVGKVGRFTSFLDSDVKLFTGEQKYASHEGEKVYILIPHVYTRTCILEPFPCSAAPSEGGKLFIRWGSLNSALGAGGCKWGHLHHSAALHPVFHAVRTRSPSRTCRHQRQQSYRKPALMQNIHRLLTKDTHHVE